jgi:phosphatidyl-myo-inositol dimannoside synthase
LLENLMSAGASSSPKKILLVLPEVFNCAGGIQMFCRALCLAAGDWAHDSGGSVSALVLNDAIAPDARYVNGDFTSYVGAGKSKAKFIRKYLRHIVSNRYDWILFGHVSQSPLALLGRMFNPRVKIGIAAYGIEVWGPLSKLQRKALGKADVVLAISEYTKAQVARHAEINADKVRIFPCTLDPHWKLDAYEAMPAQTPPAILSVARISKDDRYKGIDNVIRSLPAVVREIGPVEYRVVGRGDDAPRLRALADGLGVSRYVNFMGSLTDAELREQYKGCSLFVMPSNEEGFGIVFLEAMAYGKPVVGGANGGTPSVVTHGETGLLVDSSDVAGITQSLIELLNNKEMRERLGQAGHKRLSDRFTFHKFTENFRDVLQLV